MLTYLSKTIMMMIIITIIIICVEKCAAYDFFRNMIIIFRILWWIKRILYYIALYIIYIQWLIFKSIFLTLLLDLQSASVYDILHKSVSCCFFLTPQCLPASPGLLQLWFKQLLRLSFLPFLLFQLLCQILPVPALLLLTLQLFGKNILYKIRNVHFFKWWSKIATVF